MSCIQNDSRKQFDAGLIHPRPKLMLTCDSAIPNATSPNIASRKDLTENEAMTISLLPYRIKFSRSSVLPVGGELLLLTVCYLLTIQSAFAQTTAVSMPGPGGNFSDIQVDGDRIEIRKAASGFRNQIRIKLDADNPWWKMLRVVDKNGLAYSVEQMNGRYRTEAGNPRRMSYISIESKDLDNTFKLEFWKAKFLGVTTYIRSETYRKQDFVGRVVTFNWNDGLTAGGSSPNAPINETVSIEGKKVTIRSSDIGTKGSVKFVFRTGLAWWTAIKFLTHDGKARFITKVNGKYEPSNNTLTIPTRSLPRNTKLEFWTAKAFGVHTNMASRSFASERLDGRTITINWPK